MNLEPEEGRLCRLCRCSTDVILYNIFTEENLDIVREIQILVKRKPYVHDKLPPFVCHRCKYKLKSYKEFRSTCIESFRELESKHINNEEDDDDVIILEERNGSVLLSSGRVKSPLPDDMSSDGRESATSASSNGSRRKRRKRNKLHNSRLRGQPEVYRRQHSPDTSHLMRQVHGHYRPEILSKTRKLQHGLVGGAAFTSTLSETRPEVVDEQLGTVGFIISETDDPQGNLLRQMMQARRHTPSARRAGLQSTSLSDTEGAVLEGNRRSRCVLCNKVCENNEVMREHLMTAHGSVRDNSEQNQAVHSQQRVHRPFLSFSEEPLNRSHSGVLSINHNVPNNNEESQSLRLQQHVQRPLVSFSEQPLNRTHTDMSDRNDSISVNNEENCATRSQPYVHRPLLIFSQQPLNRNCTQTASTSHAEAASTSCREIFNSAVATIIRRETFNTSRTPTTNHAAMLTIRHRETLNTSHTLSNTNHAALPANTNRETLNTSCTAMATATQTTNHVALPTGTNRETFSSSREVVCRNQAEMLNRSHEGGFECKLCEKVFTNMVMLRQHYKDTHQL